MPILKKRKADLLVVNLVYFNLKMRGGILADLPLYSTGTVSLLCVYLESLSL